MAKATLRSVSTGASCVMGNKIVMMVLMRKKPAVSILNILRVEYFTSCHVYKHYTSSKEFLKLCDYFYYYSHAQSKPSFTCNIIKYLWLKKIFLGKKSSGWFTHLKSLKVSKVFKFCVMKTFLIAKWKFALVRTRGNYYNFCSLQSHVGCWQLIDFE